MASFGEAKGGLMKKKSNAGKTENRNGLMSWYKKHEGAKSRCKKCARSPKAGRDSASDAKSGKGSSQTIASSTASVKECRKSGKKGKLPKERAMENRCPCKCPKCGNPERPDSECHKCECQDCCCCECHADDEE